MSKLLVKCCVVILMLSNCFSVYAKQLPLNQTAFEHIKQLNKGKQWLMILWSVDCPACFKELALIKELRKKNKDLALVIINADDSDELSAERSQIMVDYEMDDLTNYYFSEGQGDKSRFMIDANWYGELPRSYFIDVQGKFHGKSGLLKKSLIKKWLKIN